MTDAHPSDQLRRNADTPEDLTVRFLDEDILLRPSEQLELGRKGDLTIDPDNRYLHRKLATILAQAGHWIIHNEGDRTVLNLDSEVMARATVPPKTSAVVPPGRSFLRFRAGRANYEIELITSSHLVIAPSASGTRTLSESIELGVNLTYRRRQVLAALAEPELRAEARPRPTAAEIARRTESSTKSVERVIDKICLQLDPNGSKGLTDNTSGQPSRPVGGLRPRAPAHHATRPGPAGVMVAMWREDASPQ